MRVFHDMPDNFEAPKVAIIDDLRTRIDDALGSLVDDGPIALVDFPDHANVGDSAIWLGEMAWFAARGIRPAYVSTLKSHDSGAMASVIGEGNIYLHGGGNFGTLWPAHQDLRIALLDRFPRRPIVQLPQSIHFEGDTAVSETARAIERHGAFTLLVRDEPSLAFARKHFQCEVRLCPDMAFYIGPLDRASPVADIFYLLRTDLEKSVEGQARGAGRSIIVGDWLTEDRTRMRLVRATSRLASFAETSHNARVRAYERLANVRLKRGIALLSSGRLVVTDRLHGHILSSLLAIPHVALDNSYRKLGNFIDAWTSALPGLRVAETLEEAASLAGELVDAGSAR